MPDEQKGRMSAAWTAIAQQLGIEVVTPYEVAGFEFDAYLPEFGGPHGMVIIGRASSTEGHLSAASEAGLYLSQIADEYVRFDRRQFQEALDDWGWYGRAGGPPDWYTGTAWTG